MVHPPFRPICKCRTSNNEETSDHANDDLSERRMAAALAGLALVLVSAGAHAAIVPPAKWAPMSPNPDPQSRRASRTRSSPRSISRRWEADWRAAKCGCASSSSSRVALCHGIVTRRGLPQHLIISGSITEYRSSCAVPIEHGAGDVTAEFGPLAHWWKNNTKHPTVLISADLLPPDMSPDESM